MQESAAYHSAASPVHWPPMETELHRRGVRLKRVGHELIGPCPVCGGVDRFAVHIAKQIWNCRGCAKGGDVVDLVQHLDGVDFAAAVETLIGEKPRRSLVRTTPKQPNGHNGGNDHERRQHAKAAWLWRQRQPITGSIPETYLRQARCYYGPLPATLGFLPARTKDQHPAMIAAFGIADAPHDVDAVHLTLLKGDGSGKADVPKPKLFVGRPLDRPIVLAPIGDTLALAITEGIEDGLSVRAALDLGVWAAGSGDRMPVLAGTVPRFVETVTIWAHADAAGRAGARKLAELLYRRGIEVFIEGAS
jgi:DNA primase